MECCYPAECEEYAVTPVLISPSPKYCEEETICYPCLPRCSKPAYYCCERKPPRSPRRSPVREREYCNPITNKCCPATPPPCPPRPEPCSLPAPSCNTCYHPPCKPVKTKYIMPCYRYEDGRIVRQLPVSAFKRNGMQDQEHSKLLGTANFLVRCPRDVSVECDYRVNPVKVADPAKVPPCCTDHALDCGYFKKQPIETNQPTVLMRRACEVACGTRARRKPFIVSSYTADPSSEIRRYHCEDERGNCCFHFERNKPAKCEQCIPVRQPYVTCPECEYVDCVYAKPVTSPSCCYYSCR